jgi:bifunctional pyridoxal-dependent enzyme with beta-cystathionase and maltose regulon repressor activities
LYDVYQKKKHIEKGNLERMIGDIRSSNDLIIIADEVFKDLVLNLL